MRIYGLRNVFIAVSVYLNRAIKIIFMGFTQFQKGFLNREPTIVISVVTGIHPMPVSVEPFISSGRT
jgi:type IV secretory pathway TrbL component